jgi:[ribosomal protein S5]-alanine N-acetyltransferase
MELFTPHLTLREFRESDLDDMCIYMTDPETQRYEHTPPLTREEIQLRIQKSIEAQPVNPRTRFDMALTCSPEDRVIGHVSLSLIDLRIREWEIGWAVNRQYWCQGYASEAALALLHLAFTQMNAHRVIAFCHVNNAASVRVMEKIGMQFEGRLREVRWLNERWYNENVYAILEKDISPQPHAQQ